VRYTTDLFLPLRDAIVKHGSQKAFAESIGISETYLSDVINGRREPGKGFLAAIGYRRVVFYERIEEV